MNWAGVGLVRVRKLRYRTRSKARTVPSRLALSTACPLRARDGREGGTGGGEGRCAAARVRTHRTPRAALRRAARALRRARAALRRLERACVAATSRLEAREQRERIGLERERLCGRPAAATGTVGIATAAIAAAAAAPCKLEAARKRRARGWQLPQPNEQLGELQVCCGLGGQTRRDRGAKIDAAGLR